MAIETLNIRPSASSLNSLNSNQTSISNSFDESINNTNKIDDDKNDDKKKKDKDKVSLSEQALNFITAEDSSKTERSFDIVSGNFVKNSVTQQALEFRGLIQIAGRRNLTEGEANSVREIKTNFENIGVSGQDILKIADKALSEFQNEANDLVQQLQSGKITGTGLDRLNKINQTLNKANGFGAEEPSDNTQQKKINDLTRQFNDVVEQTKTQELSRSQIDYLDKLQTQISQIQGYRLNVKDTVGPDGVVI